MLLISKNPYWAAQVLVAGQNKKVTCRLTDEKLVKKRLVPL